VRAVHAGLAYDGAPYSSRRWCSPPRSAQPRQQTLNLCRSRSSSRPMTMMQKTHSLQVPRKAPRQEQRCTRRPRARRRSPAAVPSGGGEPNQGVAGSRGSGGAGAAGASHQTCSGGGRGSGGRCSSGCCGAELHLTKQTLNAGDETNAHSGGDESSTSPRARPAWPPWPPRPAAPASSPHAPASVQQHGGNPIVGVHETASLQRELDKGYGGVHPTCCWNSTYVRRLAHKLSTITRGCEIVFFGVAFFSETLGKERPALAAWRRSRLQKIPQNDCRPSHRHDGRRSGWGGSQRRRDRRQVQSAPCSSSAAHVHQLRWMDCALRKRTTLSR
jgi:hypothetical protein